MAKRSKKNNKRSVRTTESSTSAPGLSHNPFANLSGFSGASVAPSVTEPSATEPSTTRSEPAAQVPLALGFPDKLVVRLEKKGRAGKTVTRISGLPAAHMAELAARMKKALGCGATQDGRDLLLLGALVERAATWLEAEGARRVVRGN